MKDKDGALQGGLSHQSSLVHRVLQAVARGWIIWIYPRRKFVEMADRGGVVGGEERAGVEWLRFFVPSCRTGCVDVTDLRGVHCSFIRRAWCYCRCCGRKSDPEA